MTYYQVGTSSRSVMSGSLHIRVGNQLFSHRLSPGRCSGRFYSAASEEAAILHENASAVCGLFLSRWPKRNIHIIVASRVTSATAFANTHAVLGKKTNRRGISTSPRCSGTVESLAPTD